ncbi:antitoxin [Inquilinus sp. NPDC058860]|uniref:antitoxin n=1 Tax=Inquilinus sp. NPDC058860 TaxID=3346652 RepID=UPI00367E9999
MPETRVLKLFRTGAGQIVRLPADFRFDGDTVYASRDARTGDVTLSDRPGADSWGEFFELMRTIDVPDGFMTERPMNVLPKDEAFSE